MNHLMAISKVLSGLAAVALLAATSPAVAAAASEGANEAAIAVTARKPANVGAEAGLDETCAAADRKESCNPPAGFPPLDMASSLFSAMTGCSRRGM